MLSKSVGVYELKRITMISIKYLLVLNWICQTPCPPQTLIICALFRWMCDMAATCINVARLVINSFITDKIQLRTSNRKLFHVFACKSFNELHHLLKQIGFESSKFNSGWRAFIDKSSFLGAWLFVQLNPFKSTKYFCPLLLAVHRTFERLSWSQTIVVLSESFSASWNRPRKATKA